MSKRERFNIYSIILAAFAAGLTALAVELSSGRVPVAEQWKWVIPVAVAMIAALAPQLKFGAEES
jgi:hypothetical protein